MEFDYEVTLSPENDKKWQEMVNDPEGRKVMLQIYKLVGSPVSKSCASDINSSHPLDCDLLRRCNVGYQGE